MTKEKINKKRIKKEKVHYIYKIHFLCGFPAGRYYLGKRTGHLNDNYGGSGNFCKAYYKKYGKVYGETYIKEILEINPDKKINADREAIIVGDLWKTDPLCMNQAPGGMANEHSGEQVYVSVRQYDLDGNFIKEWNCISDAEFELGINNISACCLGKRKIAGNWMWRYTKDNKDHLSNEDSRVKHARAVIQYDLNGNFIKEFRQITDAVKETGVNKKQIQECCAHRQHTGGGYVWKYVNEDYIRPCKRDLSKCGAKVVQQFDLNGNLINEFSSANEASKILKCSSSTISAACRKHKIAKGSIWKYKED